MTEIRVDVDLPHPPARVWQVLTDPPVINRWLTNTGFVALADGKFTVRPRGLAGIDHDLEGEVVSVDAPHTIVIKLEAPRLHTLLTVTLTPVPDGCRLTVVQRGFLGPQGTMRRRVLQRTYTEMIDERIGAELVRLAAEEPAEPEQPARREGRRNAAGPFLRIPRQPPGGRAAPPRSASAPGLASHTRPPPAGAPGVARMPGFGAAMLGAQAISAGQRPVGVVPADEVARLTDMPAAPPATRPNPEPRHRARGPFDLIRVRANAALRAGRDWIAGIPRWSPERRSQAVAALAALLLLIALVALLLARATATSPAGPPQVGGGPREPGQAGVPGQQRGAPTVRATVAVGGPAQSTGSPVPSTAPAGVAGSAAPASPLRADYQVESQRVSGYTAAITVRNPSGVPVDGWSVALELQLLSLYVHDVEGAVHAQTGPNVTFTPVDTDSRVPPGGSVTFRFQVEGLLPPKSCSVDGVPCAGVGGPE